MGVWKVIYTSEQKLARNTTPGSFICEFVHKISSFLGYSS